MGSCCCGCESAPLFADGVGSRALDIAGWDSLRLAWWREAGLRKACRVDVLRPREVKWLPAPRGVGEAADIVDAQFTCLGESLFCFAMRRSGLCRKLNVKVSSESRLSECRLDPSNRNNKWILNQGARVFDCDARARADKRLQGVWRKINRVGES